MSNETPNPLQILPEFTPTAGNTRITAGGWTSLQNVRIFDGKPQSIGGWVTEDMTPGNPSGVARMLYGQRVGTNAHLLIGTHTRLYDLLGTTNTNITPMQTAASLGSNPLTTRFGTLGSNPITTVDGNDYITIAYVGHALRVGDMVTIAGATDTNGIPAGSINTALQVRFINTDLIVVRVDTAATSTGTGGGASVTVGTGVINVTDTAHGLAEGDRVALAGASAVGGVLAAEINKEHIIREIATNSYNIVVDDYSTSAATGGGASVTRQKPIEEGNIDANPGSGFGAGYFGEGYFGEALTDPTFIIKPRIWSAGAYGDYIICTPGGGGKLYEWDGDTINAPVAVTNSPAAVNYMFIDRERIIVFYGNTIYSSEVGQRTVWTSTAQNEAYSKEMYGSGDLISHVTVNGVHLVFTETNTYTMQYIDKPLIWRVRPLEGGSGILSQNARIVADNMAYIASGKDIYAWNGGALTPIATDKIRRYVFDDLNITQKSKCFFSWVRDFSEVWFWYPSLSSDEINKFVIYNTKAGVFTGSGTMTRTAAEGPSLLGPYMRMIDDEGNVYRHEYGVNANGDALSWSAETRSMFSGPRVANISGVIPDSIQSGNVTFTAYVKDFPQSVEERNAAAQTVTPTTEEVRFDEAIIRGNVRRYRFEGAEVDGSWRMGEWMELVTEGTKRV